eukprot:scaffold265916_cov19-Prasinocladus_malaysianus.AAC.2
MARSMMLHLNLATHRNECVLVRVIILLAGDTAFEYLSSSASMQQCRYTTDRRLLLASAYIAWDKKTYAVCLII